MKAFVQVLGTLKPLLDIDDLAVVLRLSPAAIRQRAHRGSPLPPGFKIGRRYMWRPEDVIAWIDAQATRSEAAIGIEVPSESVRPEQGPI